MKKPPRLGAAPRLPALPPPIVAPQPLQHQLRPLSPRYYAVKCINNQVVPYNQRLREVNNHRAVLGHRGVLDLYGCVQQDGWSFFVLEYAEGGDMFRCMLETNVYSGDDGKIGDVFRQVVEAVRHCHRRSVFHRDLKPENIMCRKGGLDIALGDFGLSTTSVTSAEFGCGSAYYMSPECIGQGYLALKKRPQRWRPQPFDTSKNDVWCLGIILLNMICCRGPWEKACESDRDFMRYLRRPLVLREILPISWQAFALLHRIFRINPAKRITLPLLKKKLAEVGTFRMTPWELEAAHFGAQESAEIWLPLPQPRPNGSGWTRYTVYPEHLDPPRKAEMAEVTTMSGYYPMWTQLGRRDEFDLDGDAEKDAERTRVGSEDIVPSLEPSLDEDEPENVLVTPEALVGVDPIVVGEEGEEQGWIPELDLADGLEICIEGLEIWDFD
ncbi:kinase-like protein [Ceratobasidium sp. AG-I]|nr:kinase-like protein [Ceratobasidium sp. AG-I]